jgi:hypothetical protein
MYAFLADALTFVHLLYVGFVVVGLLVILVGAAFGCKWVRNPWFRSLHLLAIAIVALEGVWHIECPLTTLENHWRALAGETVSGDSFVKRLVDRVMLNNIWQQSTYEIIHISFGVLVALTYVFIPPRFRRSPRVAAPANSGGAVAR